MATRLSSFFDAHHDVYEEQLIFISEEPQICRTQIQAHQGQSPTSMLLVGQARIRVLNWPLINRNVDPENTVKVLLATDNHIGYMERDPIRGQDSINTFKEILQLAIKNDVRRYRPTTLNDSPAHNGLG